MTSFSPNWDTSWSTTSINGSTLTASGGTATTAAISNDNKSLCAVSVTVTYGSGVTLTPTVGLNVFMLRDLDGSNYEAIADNPWGFHIGFSQGGTWNQEFDVNCCMIGSFKICLYNNTDQSLTATVNYRQGTVDKT